MVGQAPPDARMSPRLTVLRAGAELWRCHPTVYPATEFNPVAAHSHFGGSRFDSTADDPYPFLYAAPYPATTLAETLVRSMEFTGPAGERRVPWELAAPRSLSKVEVTEELLLVRLLTGEDLAGVFQTSWLVEADEPQYAQTRYWAREIRRQTPRAQGFVWQSRRNRPENSLVLFGDRCGPEPLKAVAGQTYNLGTFEGAIEANRWLKPLRAVIVPPASRP
ncbi:RES family NAD+ phosphorylase [Streptomyces sp. NPDC055078]